MKEYFAPNAELTRIATGDIITASGAPEYENFAGDVADAMPTYWEGYLG